jgi:hypothetical protein
LNLHSLDGNQALNLARLPIPPLQHTSRIGAAPAKIKSRPDDFAAAAPHSGRRRVLPLLQRRRRHSNGTPMRRALLPSHSTARPACSSARTIRRPTRTVSAASPLRPP